MPVTVKFESFATTSIPQFSCVIDLFSFSKPKTMQYTIMSKEQCLSMA